MSLPSHFAKSLQPNAPGFALPLPFLLLLLLLAVSLCACEKSKESAANSEVLASASNTEMPEKRHIALVMKTLSNPFFVEMEKGAHQAEKEFGLHLIVRATAAETSVEQQIQIIDDLILQKVGAIVIAPADSQRLIPVLKKAQLAGVKIVNIDNQLNADGMASIRMQTIPLVSVDNEKASYLAAKLIAKEVQHPTEAAILEGMRTAENANARLRGAQLAFAENPHIKLVASETANWKIDEAFTVTAKIFKQHPNIRLLFCANDMMALGALKYLQDSGNDNVAIVSYDALNDVITEIKNGRIVATVDQQAALQAYRGVELAYKMLRGENVPNQLWVEARLVSAKTLSP